METAPDTARPYLLQVSQVIVCHGELMEWITIDRDSTSSVLHMRQLPWSNVTICHNHATVDMMRLLSTKSV